MAAPSRPAKSRVSCRSCARSHIRCDRLLPACSRCADRVGGVPCEYPDPAPRPLRSQSDDFSGATTGGPTAGGPPAPASPSKRPHSPDSLLALARPPPWGWQGAAGHGQLGMPPQPDYYGQQQWRHSAPPYWATPPTQPSLPGGKPLPPWAHAGPPHVAQPQARPYSPWPSVPQPSGPAHPGNYGGEHAQLPVFDSGAPPSDFSRTLSVRSPAPTSTSFTASTSFAASASLSLDHGIGKVSPISPFVPFGAGGPSAAQNGAKAPPAADPGRRASAPDAGRMSLSFLLSDGDPPSVPRRSSAHRDGGGADGGEVSAPDPSIEDAPESPAGGPN